MEQTTVRKETIDDIITDLKAQRDAMKKRIRFLEWRLEQRIQLTQNLYQKRREHFNRMQDLAYRIFLDNPKVAFNYDDLAEEWKRRYPNISYLNVPRRVQELTEKQLLWRVEDPESRKVRHFLRLEELKEDGKEEQEQD